MKVTKSDVGRTCIVQYDDIGKVEGMVVEVDTDPGTKCAKVFTFYDRNLDPSIDLEQILSLGDYICPPQ